MYENRLLLIIDDDIDDVEMFCEAVIDVDNTAECCAAADGYEAIDLIMNKMRKLPDFIFLDLNLPKMDGLECLILLRAENRLKSVPIIIYTSSSAPNDMYESKLLGANYFLRKTSDYKTLCDEIALILKTDWSPIVVESH
ncbi:MAG TPA: response regulator [Saprospiraceae bacterium]|nr:response regulator [Saprospiraceae bacterium]